MSESPEDTKRVGRKRTGKTMKSRERWIELKDGQYPRKGELIMVRDKKSIYPYLLCAEGNLDWWVWNESAQSFFKRHHEFSGTKLSFHGITHWILLESPY